MSLVNSCQNLVSEMRKTTGNELLSLSIRGANISKYKKDIELELLSIREGYGGNINNLINANGKYNENYMKTNCVKLVKKY